jgi:hypothetical protein
VKQTKFGTKEQRMQLILVIELAFLTLFLIKAGIAGIKRDLLRLPVRRDDTDEQ